MRWIVISLGIAVLGIGVLDFRGEKRDISFYDDTTGTIIEEARMAEGKEFACETPSFSRHIALPVKSVD